MQRHNLCLPILTGFTLMAITCMNSRSVISRLTIPRLSQGDFSPETITVQADGGKAESREPLTSSFPWGNVSSLPPQSANLYSKNPPDKCDQLKFTQVLPQWFLKYEIKGAPVTSVPL